MVLERWEGPFWAEIGEPRTGSTVAGNVAATGAIKLAILANCAVERAVFAGCSVLVGATVDVVIGVVGEGHLSAVANKSAV
jgi:hypothetical protein